MQCEGFVLKDFLLKAAKEAEAETELFMWVPFEQMTFA